MKSGASPELSNNPFLSRINPIPRIDTYFFKINCIIIIIIINIIIITIKYVYYNYINQYTFI